jgi:hypothetical protein
MILNLMLWLVVGCARGDIHLRSKGSSYFVSRLSSLRGDTLLIREYQTAFETTLTSVRITLVQTIILNTTLPQTGLLTVTSIASATDIITAALPGSAVGASRIVICPTPTNSIHEEPQDSGPNALWGCSPGFICSPPKPDNCEIWAGPPNYDYVCDAKSCIPSPSFTSVVWLAGNTSKYPLTGYFNLNPNSFGLNYSIFITTEVSKVSTAFAGRDRKFPAIERPRDIIRRISSAVPAVCYAQCNNGYIEAQRLGKSAIICARDSAFQSGYQSCQTCVGANSNISKAALQNIIDPRFAPFVSFCDAQSELTNVGSISTETTTPVETMQSMVIIPTALTINRTSASITQYSVLSDGSTVLSPTSRSKLLASSVLVPTKTAFGPTILPSIFGSGPIQDTSIASNTSRSSLILSGGLIIISVLWFLSNH